MSPSKRGTARTTPAGRDDRPSVQSCAVAVRPAPPDRPNRTRVGRGSAPAARDSPARRPPSDPARAPPAARCPIRPRAACRAFAASGLPSRPAACLHGQIDIHGELGRQFVARFLSGDELAWFRAWVRRPRTRISPAIPAATRRSRPDSPGPSIRLCLRRRSRDGMHEEPGPDPPFGETRPIGRTTVWRRWHVDAVARRQRGPRIPHRAPAIRNGPNGRYERRPTRRVTNSTAITTPDSRNPDTTPTKAR